MKIEFKNAKDFYKLLNFISQWQKEIQVVFTPEKLSILTMSQCSTVFITCELPSEYFNLYQCKLVVIYVINARKERRRSV